MLYLVLVIFVLHRFIIKSQLLKFLLEFSLLNAHSVCKLADWAIGFGLHIEIHGCVSLAKNIGRDGNIVPFTGLKVR